MVNKSIITTGFVLSILWMGLGLSVLSLVDSTIRNYLLFVGLFFIFFASVLWITRANARFSFIPRPSTNAHLQILLLNFIFLTLAFGLRLWLSGEASFYWFLYTLGPPIIITITLYLNKDNQ